jgi:hypothetical protein
MTKPIWLKVSLPAAKGHQVYCEVPLKFFIEEAIRLNNWGELARGLQSAWCLQPDLPLSDNLQRFLVDVLNGATKRPANTPPSFTLELRNRLMCVALLSIRDAGHKNAEDELAELFGVDRRTVQRVTKGLKFANNDGAGPERLAPSKAWKVNFIIGDGEKIPVVLSRGHDTK